MLSAGIPILETVESILEDVKGNQRKILETLRDDVIAGKRIHTTLVKFPRVFDRVTTNVIKAAEEAGTLDVTLKDLRENIRREIEFSDRIKAALIYPVFIIVVFFGVLTAIIFFVIPRIADVFGRLRVDLPLPTRILIFISNLFVKQGFIILGIALVLGIGFFLLLRFRRNAILNIFYSLPYISSLVQQIDLARFSRSLYLLLYSGIPITAALDLASDVVIKKETAKVISASKEMVLSGRNLSEGMRASKGKVPAIVIKLIEAGEKTGSLDKSMQEISEYFDYQVSNTLKTITALIEPVMLVIVGIVVGGMMMAIIAPIYGLIGKVGSR